MDDVIYLLTAIYTKDQYGVPKPTYTSRKVFCHVESITRAEFFDAGRNGLNPEFVFVMFFGDYHGEETCEFHGKTYGIYRTYHVPGTDDIELYVERKGGSNGISENPGGTAGLNDQPNT